MFIYIYIQTQVRAGRLGRVGPPLRVNGAAFVLKRIWLVLVYLHFRGVPDQL